MQRKWRRLLLALVLLAGGVALYVRTHPLVFMETHAHCIKFAGLELLRYADEHQGRFPVHRNGYGGALLLLDDDCLHTLTGPGYEATPLREAKRAGRHLPEEECGRVYVQGLSRKSNPEIALLFDKLPTPGGDHCPFPARLWAPLGREVLFVSIDEKFVPGNLPAETKRRPGARGPGRESRPRGSGRGGGATANRAAPGGKGRAASRTRSATARGVKRRRSGKPLAVGTTPA